MKRIHFLIIIGILLFPMVYGQNCDSSGYMGKFYKGTNVTITETCPTCSFINITIKDPDSLILKENIAMILSNNLFSYNLTSENTNRIGIYYIEGVSNLDLPVKACFEVTDKIKQVETGDALIYIVLISLFSLIIMVTVYYSFTVPYSNKEGPKGIIIPTKLKYVKMGLITITYALITWVLNLFWILSYNFIGETAFNSAIEFMFNFMLRMVKLFFVLMLLIAIYNLIKDYDLKRSGKRAMEVFNLK